MEASPPRRLSIVSLFTFLLTMFSFSSALTTSISRGRRYIITTSLKTTTRTAARRWKMTGTSDDTETDEYGRRIRTRSSGGGGWDDFDPFQEEPSRGGGDRQRQQKSSREDGINKKNSGGWDDDDNNLIGNAPQKTRSSGGWDDFDPFQEKPSGGGGQRRDTGGDKRNTRNSGGWDDDNNNFNSDAPKKTRGGGGWDDFDQSRGGERGGGGGGGGRGQQQRQRKSTGGGGGGNRNNQRSRGNDNRRDNRSNDWRSDRQNNNSNSNRKFDQRRNDNNKGRNDDDDQERRINMRALEGAGFVHLYGIASCLNALQANRRDFTRPEDMIRVEDLEGADLQHELQQRERKAEAQFSPNLFVQDNSQRKSSTRSTDKAMAAEKLEALANELSVPINKVDKGVLNALSGNRPHQGFVLRCGKLDWEPITKLPVEQKEKKLWLCLDEVVDPQNLGALLRSAYFLSSSRHGNDDHDSIDIGIVVCGKNSAPPSPVVSAASAGALEVADMYSTSNLPKLLSQAQQNGFRIVGASSSEPQQQPSSWINDEYQPKPQKLYELQDLPPISNEDDEYSPTILVLGSEGHGLRTLVAKACTEFVRIPGGNTQEDDGGGGVDSLNVSVTGGILLWHLLQGK